MTNKDVFKQEMRDFIQNNPADKVVDCLVTMVIFLDTKKSLKKSDAERLADFEKKYELSVPQDILKETISQLDRQKMKRMLNIMSDGR